MNNIRFYHVKPEYIDYLAGHEPHLFHNKTKAQQNERKYIGIILQVEGMDYFAPLSSYKAKHDAMKETLDFIKIRKYAVINLNNMFPVPKGQYEYVDFSRVQNPFYRSLLLSEYRYVKSIQTKILRNASVVYSLKVSGEQSSLTKRCNDLSLFRAKRIFAEKCDKRLRLRAFFRENPFGEHATEKIRSETENFRGLALNSPEQIQRFQKA